MHTLISTVPHTQGGPITSFWFLFLCTFLHFEALSYEVQLLWSLDSHYISVLGSARLCLSSPSWAVVWKFAKQQSEIFVMFTSFISHLLEIIVFCCLLSITLKNVLCVLSGLFCFLLFHFQATGKCGLCYSILVKTRSRSVFFNSQTCGLFLFIFVTNF